MNRPVLSLIVFGAFAMQGTIANACRIARQPVDPIQQQYDAAAFATVSSTSDGEALIKLGSVLRGVSSKREAKLVFDYNAAREAGDESFVIVSCGPGGPKLAKGELIVVYFKNEEISRWALATEMIARDPHVEAAFLNAHSVASRKSKRDLARRADEVVKFKGPVPLSDPAKWVEGYKGTLGWDYVSQNYTTFRFEVERDGKINYCRQSGGKRKENEVLEGICEELAANASFKRPRLTQEKTGIFMVHWPAEAEAMLPEVKGQSERASTS